MRRIDVDLLVRNHAGQDRGDGDVKNRAQDKRTDDADRHVAARIARFFGVGRDRVEADVGVENDSRAGHHAERLAARSMLSHDRVSEKADAAITVGRERPPIGGVDVEDADGDDQKHDGQLDHDHEKIERRAAANAGDQNHRQYGRDQQRGRIDDRAGGDETRRSPGLKSKGAFVKAAGG